MVVLYIVAASAVGLLSLLGAFLGGVPSWVSAVYYVILGVGLGAAGICVLAGIALFLLSKTGKGSSEKSDLSSMAGSEPRVVRILAVGETSYFAKFMPEIVPTSADAEVCTAASEAEALKLLASDPSIDCLVVPPSMQNSLAFFRQIRAMEAYVAMPVLTLPADGELKSTRDDLRAEREGQKTGHRAFTDWHDGLFSEKLSPLTDANGGAVNRVEERSIRAYRHANALY